MKKIVTLLLALVTLLASLALVSCSKIDPAADLDRVRDAGVIKIGMECAYAPFNWTQSDDEGGAVKIANAAGYANGYDVQVAKAVAEELGVTLEIYQYRWEALIDGVKSGKLDAIIAGMSPTDERKEEIDFSANYYVSNLVVIVEKDNPIAGAATLDAIAGKKIGAQDGTFHALALEQIPNVKGTVMDDFTILYTALTAHTIDGYIAEEPTAYAVCSRNNALGYLSFVNNENGFTCDESDTAIAVGMRKGSTLADAINRAVNAIDEETRSEWMRGAVALAPAEE